MSDSTKERMLDAGLRMLLRHGYNDLGIQAVLQETGMPKGSFYHHFKSKEDFALQVIDLYMSEVHNGLDDSLGDRSLPPLDRVRKFFESTRDKYQEEGYLGCMLGGLGQELSGISPVFQQKIESCLSIIAGRIKDCLEEARDRGDLPSGSDLQLLADLVVNCWEGAALRSRLRRDPTPLDTMLDFYFASVASSPSTPA
ncbi:TetR/AcrR family transcriptional regulator [Chelativorans sp. M5D2P16]|uniref:TetR/AcrR family transcriptional regulator n=1 Tax=Chelativorans sp. M5D2P16 TaxID=3095678 RepID=UPI002ACA34AE|nr:TetR family transcriptional regulator C-terminal domain-containing protein [Chelativorans sp. M5D2P16]MDZ5698504.1 TetR family transcriptional regulator C-terminal domain-containing protein [Chelativorans sp. M5D2P16]